MNFLCSDSDTDGSINVVRITDQGNHLRKATVEIAGVPATGSTSHQFSGYWS